MFVLFAAVRTTSNPELGMRRILLLLPAVLYLIDLANARTNNGYLYRGTNCGYKVSLCNALTPFSTLIKLLAYAQITLPSSSHARRQSRVSTTKTTAADCALAPKAESAIFTPFITHAGMLNVHIVCHTHLDTGWVETYEEYYHRCKSAARHPMANSKPSRSCCRCARDLRLGGQHAVREARSQVHRGGVVVFLEMVRRV